MMIHAIRSGRSRSAALAGAVLVLCLHGAAGSPAFAADFRSLEIQGGFSNALPDAVNANGDQVVGFTRQSGTTLDHAVIWREDSHAIEFVGPSVGATDGTEARGQETSADGLRRRTIGTLRQAGATPDRIWTRVEDAGAGSDTVTVLPAHPNASASNHAVDISRSGHLAGHSVSGSTTTAFFYDPATTTYTDIPDLLAEDMDAEGTRIVGVGIANEEAVVWEAATNTRQVIPALSGGAKASAKGISASGRIVVGSSESGALGGGDQEAFRWHPDIGTHALEPIGPGESRISRAYATSDANIVVGSYFNLNAGADRAFIWTPDYGRRDLKTVLQTTYSIDTVLLADWVLTAATAISADGMVIAGEGIDPNGAFSGWIVDLRDEDIAEIEIRPVNYPTDWEFYLHCGDTAISEISFGVIPPVAFSWQDAFDFGGCNNPIFVGQLPAYDCTGGSGIGPNVDPSSYVLLPQEDNGAGAANARADALYFTISGSGGGSGNLLCEPGDDEQYLARFSIHPGLPTSAAIEPVTSAFAPAIGRDVSGDYLPDSIFRLRRSPEPGGFQLSIRPALTDVDGSKWMTTLEADTPLAKFSFGIVLPTDTAGQTASFGGCNQQLAGSFVPRGCANGAGLGSRIDFTKVRTLGPDPNLEFQGMRGDTLYVYVEGSQPGIGSLDQLNIENQQARLGLFAFDGTISPDPGFIPVITMEGIDVFDVIYGDVSGWEDVNGMDFSGSIVLTSGEWTGTSGTNWDGDAYEDAHDMCPYVVSGTGIAGQEDYGTLEQFDPGGVTVPVGSPDGIGNECQCGDSGNDATVVGLDIDRLRAVFADPGRATELMSDPDARRKCNSYGPVFLDDNPATGLPFDCQLNDVFVLLKAQQGQQPLIPDLDPMAYEFPSCPDVTTP